MNDLRHSRRVVRPLFLALALGLAPATAVTAAPTAASACAASWGSLAEQRAPHTGKQLTNIRSGRHRCFDRLVLDINADGKGTPGYRIRYVARILQDGSGAEVPLRGAAQLRVIVNAPAYDRHGNPTYEPTDKRELVDVAGYRTFRQVAWAGTFEGQTTIGLGVRARLPWRVLVLRNADGGHRVVVDVAHRWS